MRDPAAPAVVGSFETPGELWDIQVVGTTAYAFANNEGLRIIDISDPTKPVLLNSYKMEGYGGTLQIVGTTAYIVARSNLYIVDISDPSSLTLLGSLKLIGHFNGIHVVDTTAYITGGGNGLDIVDVSDPTTPTLLGNYDTPGAAQHVHVVNNIAYVADLFEHLQIIDVRDPANPTLIGSYDTPDVSTFVKVVDSTAYVGDRLGGLLLIDVSTPASPVLIGSYDTGNAWGLQVVDNLVYVADRSNGLQIVDVRDPANPTLSGEYDLPEYANMLQVVNDLAYVAAGYGGLHILRISEGAPPTPTPTVAPDQESGISGTVTDSDNTPLKGIHVIAVTQQDTAWESVQGTTTLTDGRYLLADLPTGDYRVRFVDPLGTYAPEFYDDQSDLDGADTVTVNTGTVQPDIDAVLEKPTPPKNEAETSCGAPITIDPQTGKITVGQANSRLVSHGCDVTIKSPVSCSDGTEPLSVTLKMERNRHVGHDIKYYSMEPAADKSGGYQATVPGEDLPTIKGERSETFPLSVQWMCGDDEMSEDIGQIILFDPSGNITNAQTGDPVSDATVTLFKVPGWRARTGADDTAPQTCESNLSKAEGAAWSQPAPTEEGILADPELMEANGTQEIDPLLNPQVTGSNGYYGWDVAGGCWYVEVQAEGYVSQTSPVVGVPPEVTDLDIALEPEDGGVTPPDGDESPLYIPARATVA